MQYKEFPSACTAHPRLYCTYFIQAVISLRSVTAVFRKVATSIDPFPKRHRLVHNGRFLKFVAKYCSFNIMSSIEIL